MSAPPLTTPWRPSGCTLPDAGRGDGRAVVRQAGAVLSAGDGQQDGLGQVISAALVPWHSRGAVHDPGGILLDIALAVALGGDCHAGVATLRCQPSVFGAVASAPTVSRPGDTLAAPWPSSSTTAPAEQESPWPPSPGRATPARTLPPTTSRPPNSPQLPKASRRAGAAPHHHTAAACAGIPDRVPCRGGALMLQP